MWYNEKDCASQDALDRTAAHLEKLQRLDPTRARRLGMDFTSVSGMNSDEPLDDDEEQMETIQRSQEQYLQQSANALKEILKERRLPQNGRKPDLAWRLARDDWQRQQQQQQTTSVLEPDPWLGGGSDDMLDKQEERHVPVVSRFAGRPLSVAAGTALGRAGFVRPTSIQAAALPRLMQGESLIVHAETGSGKSLAYLLPITEHLWGTTSLQPSQEQPPLALILTPTRELAAQVAGIATTLAPPGTVRMVARPINLLSSSQKDRGEAAYQGLEEHGGPRIFVGSAKTIHHSLYGNGKEPAAPTPKPLAMTFLQSIQWLVLDEVDRLLPVAASHKRGGKQRHVHEKPAAVLTAAVARSTLGRAQVMAASATVGRPLRREVARVLGLEPQQGPPVVRALDDTLEDDNADSMVGKQVGTQQTQQRQQEAAASTGRAVTIPDTVTHSIHVVTGSSEGKLLTGALRVIQHLMGHRKTHNDQENKSSFKMLLVLCKSFGMSTNNVVGALKHFQCRPEPQSLLDALQGGDYSGTDPLMERHRQVTGATGIGESFSSSGSPTTKKNGNDDSVLWVTGEDSVRGLHLDGLDVVLMVGRPTTPNEYTHIAGRTGRAGKPGHVIAIVSPEHAIALQSWETMLEIALNPLVLDTPLSDHTTGTYQQSPPKATSALDEE